MTGEQNLPAGALNKIAVVRANGIGDYFFVVPALMALRETFPAAEIVLLALDWHAAFLRGRPGPVDRVIVVPPYAGVGAPERSMTDTAAHTRFFAAMQAEGFDLAFQLHGGGRHSNSFVQQLGARVTYGLRTPDAVPLDYWVPYLLYQSEVMRYLEVVALAGATTRLIEPTLAVLPSDLAESRRVVPEGDAPLVALLPGATDPRRRWPAEHFAVVGDALAAEGAQVVICGAAEDRETAAQISAAMRTTSIDTTDKLSLGGLTGLLARCRVAIGNDTGPRHLAAAVGTRTVGIFWCANLLLAGPATRTRHRPQIAWRVTCPICGCDFTRSDCEHRASVVADVPTTDVIAAAHDLFTQS